jgi:hypothetical protein
MACSVPWGRTAWAGGYPAAGQQAECVAALGMGMPAGGRSSQSKKGGTGESPAFRQSLSAQLERLEDGIVTRLLGTLEVVEQFAAARDHHEETATGRMILRVRAEVLGEMVDAVSQAHDLYVCTTGVLLMDLEGLRIGGCGLAH